MAYRYRNAHLSNIVIDGENCTRYFTFPFTIQETLDESLDSAMIQLTGMKRKEPFKPFTDAELGTDVDGRIDMLVANDEVTEIFGRGLYNHQITLIEPTKLLERYVMGAKAFTNHAVKNYALGAQNAKVFVKDYYGAYKNSPSNFQEVPNTIQEFTTNQYVTCVTTSKNFYIPPLIDVCDLVKKQGVDYLGEHHFLAAFGVQVYFSNERPQNQFDISNMIRIYSSDSETSNINVYQNGIWLDLDLLSTNLMGYPLKQGYYIVEYVVVYRNFILLDSVDFVVDSTMMQYEQRIKIGTQMVPPVSNETSTYTIQEVLSTLNRQVRPLKRGENPNFTFSWSIKKGQDERVNNTRAPEFKFPTGQTFWENLREVFKFMHWIPRLKRDRDPNAKEKYAIYADELGGNEYADMSKGERVSGSYGISAADYADALEANVSNLLNADDELEGSIVTPCAGGGITIRSDSARIEDKEGSYIPTPYPIEKLLKLEAFATFGDSNRTIDLTPYVFEKTEYDTLSSFSGVFPHSKTYALYYTQGSRNIQGLFYRADDAVGNFSSLQKRYAITNIVNAIMGLNVNELGYFSIVYRVTYVPTITARVRQFKTDREGRGENGTLVLTYNQSANKLAARAFGENMRGQIAMLGNKTGKATYLFGSYNDIPKPGLLFDDKNYISTVTTRVHPDFCVSEICLSEGYNELGGYLELNNAHRQFEIPGECERHYHIDELCVISSNKDTHNYSNGFIASSKVMEYIMQTFTGNVQGYTDISHCFSTTYDDNGEPLQMVNLPVASTSVGTSLYFGYRYEDNFSAGSSSQENGGLRYTRYEPYGDALARAKYLAFSLENGEVLLDGTRWLEQGHAYPLSRDLRGYNWVLSSPMLCYDKDAADGGDVSYQLHFVSDSGFIIGEALARHCPLVRSNPSRSEAAIYFYDHRINELTGYSGIVNNDGFVASSKLDISNTGVITVKDIPDRQFKAWKIVKITEDGKHEFLLGANSDTVPKNIYFGFKRP